jgi:hypothetical protein
MWALARSGIRGKRGVSRREGMELWRGERKRDVGHPNPGDDLSGDDRQ